MSAHIGGLRRLGVMITALAALLGTTGCLPFGNDRVTVTATFADTAGLFVGNDVGVLGVKVGQIVEITPKGRLVEVTMEVDADVDVPADVGAVTVARSVATDRYVELTPVYEDGPKLEAGDTIPLKRTRTPVEFDELLETLGELSEGIGGENGDGETIRALLQVSAGALDGRGHDFNQTLSQLAIAAGSLADHRAEITGTVDDLDALTTLLAGNKDAVDEFITSIADATDMFAQERKNFGRSLRALDRALSSLADFSKENRKQLEKTSMGLAEVTDDLLDHRVELEESLVNLPLTFDNIGRAVGRDNRLRVKLPLTDLSPLKAVTEPLCELLPEAICRNLGTSPDLSEIINALIGGALG